MKSGEEVLYFIYFSVILPNFIFRCVRVKKWCDNKLTLQLYLKRKYISYNVTAECVVQERIKVMQFTSLLLFVLMSWSSFWTLKLRRFKFLLELMWVVMLLLTFNTSFWPFSTFKILQDTYNSMKDRGQ